MKHFFQYAACLFVFAAAAVSCNHDAGDDDKNVTYPQTMALGNWYSESTNDPANTYVVSLSVGAKGDTVCTLVKTNKETGKVNSAINGKCAYNPLVGMATANFAKTPEAGNPAGEVYIAYQHTFDAMTVRYRTYTANKDGKAYKEIATFRAVACKGFNVANSTYFDPTQTYGVAFNSDNTCGYMFGSDAESGEGLYTFDLATGTGSVAVVDGNGSPTGKSYSLSVNALNQLVMSDGQTAVALYRE